MREAFLFYNAISLCRIFLALKEVLLMLIVNFLLRSGLVLQLVQCDVYAIVQVALVQFGEVSG
jgi:hypothetical protein